MLALTIARTPGRHRTRGRRRPHGGAADDTGCRRSDHRRSHGSGDRARVDPDQGGADRPGSRSARRRQPRLGEPVRGPAVDVLAGRRLGRGAAELRGPGRRRAATPRGRAGRSRRPGRVGDDARLPRVRRRRCAAHAVPHLAQHEHGPGGRAAQRGVRRQHPAPVERRAPLPGDPGRRGARRPARPPDHPGRLRALAAHRREGPRRRRRQRHVPDRRAPPAGTTPRCWPGSTSWPPRPGSSWTLAELLPAIAVAGRPAGTLTDSGREAARPDRAAAPRHPALPARGRRGHGDGRHQLGRPAHRQRLRRDVHLRHGRARARARPGAPRTGPGHHAGRRPGGDGALQQRRQ